MGAVLTCSAHWSRGTECATAVVAHSRAAGTTAASAINARQSSSRHAPRGSLPLGQQRLTQTDRRGASRCAPGASRQRGSSVVPTRHSDDRVGRAWTAAPQSGACWPGAGHLLRHPPAAHGSPTPHPHPQHAWPHACPASAEAVGRLPRTAAPLALAVGTLAARAPHGCKSWRCLSPHRSSTRRSRSGRPPAVPSAIITLTPACPR